MSRVVNAFLLISGVLTLFQTRLAATVTINEIMYHPAGDPVTETTREWIELRNSDLLAGVNLGGCKFTKGIDFEFPTGTTIGPGGYLVVAANVAAFQAANPGVINVVGGWVGKLSNSGETIRLESAVGSLIHEISYADEGDWALRARGPDSFGHRGWIWTTDADGLGKSVELRSLALAFEDSGQNWAVSTPIGGTPGAVNSVTSTNVAPLITDVQHQPEIPRTTEPIRISARLADESPGNVTATLRWRIDGAASFQTLAMTDTDADGDVEATIPAQTTNLTIIEWYISATDGTNTRTWPAPAQTSNPGVTPITFGQLTNALVQVDNGYAPGATFRTAADNPIYRLILTDAERDELVQLQSEINGEQDSDAAFNGTFISYDGTGIKTRYRCSVRNRGQGSASGPPNNYHVSFLSSEPWNARTSIALNCRFPYSQALGQALMARMGLPTQDAAIVKVRLNGADLAQTGFRMYGRYVRLEGRGGAWAEQHYPNDPDGNFYRLDDHIDLANSNEFRFQGTDAAAYSPFFLKETNKEINDYSDLINFCRVISAPATGGTLEQPAISDAAYPGKVAEVLDIDETFRFLAIDTLIGNQEGGFTSGRTDDASMYRGVLDPRFRFIPHDLDTIFDIGDTQGGLNRNIFSFDGGNNPGTGVLGMARFFNHPQLVPRYYAALQEAVDSWSNHTTDPVPNYNPSPIDAIIDQIMSGWVPASDGVPAAPNRGIQEIKAFIDARAAIVDAAIQKNYTATVTGTVTPEGYRQTTDGSATFTGTFHVAKTYSITVNGQPATVNYRTNTAAGTTAGTWSLGVPVGGGTVLKPGLNKVVVKFWDAPNGTGNVLQAITVDVLNQPATGNYATVAGTIGVGSLRLVAPASFLPGKPFLVRVDLLNDQGKVDRTAWNTSVALNTSITGLTLPNVQLYNGMGSALVTVGGAAGGTTQLIPPGGTLAAPNATGPQWRMLDSGAEPAATWKSSQAFDDSTWRLGFLQAGAGDNDERTTLNNVPGSALNTRRAFYFRKIFNVADPSTLTSLQIKAVVDDGAIFYLNGTEIYNDGVAGGAGLTIPASANRTGGQETQIRTFDVSAFLSLLQPGDNLLAVEVHNYSLGTTYSADLSFDCELDGIAPSGDPGSIVLSASGAGFAANKTITSLGSAPATTTVSTNLPVGPTTWSGVIHVTENIAVPAGGTLTIAAGTHVLVDGDLTVGGHNGKRITVNGTLNVNGTLASPVNITATTANERWGQLIFSNAQPSTLNYALISNLGRGPNSSGHTGRCAMLSLNSSTLTLNESVVGDGPGKALLSSGSCSLTLEGTLLNRVVTGPELGNGCALHCKNSNIQLILPNYREDDPATAGTNEAAPDDEDCLYVHNDTDEDVIVEGSVFARCGDDVFDGLGGPLTVTDSILREGWDKGMSLLNNDLVITNTQIIQCDKAIVPKSQNADTRTVTATNVTIVSENHDTTQPPWGYSIPPSGPDPDSPSTGFYTQNKSGQSNAGAILQINAKNCIVIAQEPVKIDPPYLADKTVVTYSDLYLDTGATFSWPGIGNISNPALFVSAATGDYHLTAASPARNAGNPAGTDMGALPYAVAVQPAMITWTPAGGPYRITANTTIPAGTTLNIQPGTAVYFNQNARLTVNGRMLAQGSPSAHITFSHVPGTIAAGDADPIKNLTQTGPPKWGGVRVVDSMAQESVFSYCDFLNAQGVNPSGDPDPVTHSAENWGSLGFIRSWGRADHLTFAGTHLRMCYGRNSKLTVTYCNFPDMFLPDSGLGRIEVPTDFLGAADNRMEPLKVEYPVGSQATNPELLNNPNFTSNGLPKNGHWRVYFNDFHGNRGHQDVFDADSGRWDQRGPTGNQLNEQFVLDCRYNTFHGLTGDEHIDLGGDAYIANNRFYSGSKDQWTIDTGYANAISSGDKGSGTTILVARNVFFDLDHAINCKINTATIFEHNTLADFHQDWQYNHTESQFVQCSAVNLYVPNDGNAAGDGAYIAYNIFYGNVPAPDHILNPDPPPDPPGGFPRLISWPDQTIGGATTSVIRIENNFVDSRILDENLGANHPGGIFAPAWGFGNVKGDPLFANKTTRDFSLQPGSPAKGTANGGLDFGATVPEWAYILNAPPAETASTTINLIVGGPGLVNYKWRVDGGAWTEVLIGAGGVMPRTGPIVRQSTIALNGLANGPHMVEVLGQDMAGNWQDADPARTLEGTPQFGPTKVAWTVNTALQSIRINELLADSATVPPKPDTVELYNGGGADVNLGGWTLSDDPLTPAKYTIPPNTMILSGNYLVLSSTTTGINLDRDGDGLYLYNGGTLVDSVVFGHQIPDLTIGRVGPSGTWTLCTFAEVTVPATVGTFGGPNVAQRMGSPSSLRINEWFTSGDVLYDNDWIELANTGALPVSLGGLRLTDNSVGNPALHVIAPLSFIAPSPNGFVKFIADGQPTLGATHLNFLLDAEQEEIALLEGTTKLDGIFFYPQTTDYSMGRDATTPSGFTFYELPTAGFANGTAHPGYANALALLRGLRITEIMFNPAGGNLYEFIELRNVGLTPLELGGVKFVQGIEFTFPAMTLNPGKNVILVADQDKFQERYGNGPNVGGQYEGRLDNSGETLAIQLPPPFDANVLTFNFSDQWQPSTDGLGKSLVVTNPLLPSGKWGDKDTWTASTADGGDPDGILMGIPTTYDAWSLYYSVPNINDDGDHDGVGALVEFSLRMNPTSAQGADGALGLPSITLATDGHLEMQMLVPHNPSAVQLNGRAQIVYTVQVSDDVRASWTTIAEKTLTTAWNDHGLSAITVGPPANGFVLVTIHDNSVAGPNHYMRLQVTFVP